MKKLTAALLMGLAFTAVAQIDLSILATRGDGVVTQDDFDAAMGRIPEEDHGNFLRSSERFETMVSNMLLYSQLAAEARKAGYDADPLVAAQMKLAAEKELANAWLEEQVAGRETPDLEGLAREYYAANPNEFLSAPSVDVTHILVSNQSRSNEDARTIADEVLAKIKADPDSFDALVTQYSEDPSMVNNQGRFPSVKRGDMVREFEEAAFSLEEGQVSDPVYTRFGYHIIRLNGKSEAGVRDFEEVKGGLMRKELRAHRERMRLDYLSNLTHQETKITNEQLLQALSRYFTEDEMAELANPTN